MSRVDRFQLRGNQIWDMDDDEPANVPTTVEVVCQLMNEVYEAKKAYRQLAEAVREADNRGNIRNEPVVVFLAREE